MSINSAASIALSGMLATQVQLSVTAANISNADTVGYTEKTANQVAVSTGGAGAGTAITSIDGTVNAFILKSLVGSISDLGAANSKNDYLDQLQALYGSTGTSGDAGTSLGNTLASMESAIAALANTPNSASLQANAVGSADAVASQLRDISAGIQSLRGSVDQNIATSVGDMNKQLQLIGSLNLQIQQATATGQSTADLMDQRNTALQSVASDLPVSYFTASNGSLQVYTASGQALVDSSVHTVTYTPASSVTASTAYSSTPPSGFGGIMVNGVDITSQVNSGSVGALVNLRDSVLPGAQAQLDELATQLQSTLNAAHNQGTAVPAPEALTGTATVTAATALSGSGTVRIGVVDQDNDLVSYQDLDLSAYATVGDLVGAINGISGLSASIDADGHVAIAATGANTGVAINEMSSAVGSAGQGLSDWLGLNDLLVGSSASDIAVRGDILKNPALLATATLDSSASPSVGAQVLSGGSSKAANNLYNALIGNTGFAAVAGIGDTTASFANYAADIVASVATQASNASSDYANKQTAQSSFQSTMSSESGVNLDQETARLSSLQNQYSAAAELLQVINQMFSSLITAMQSSAA